MGLSAPRRQVGPPGTERKKSGFPNAEKSAAEKVSTEPSGSETDEANVVESRMLSSWAVDARRKP